MKEMMKHMSVKIMMAVVIELCAISFVLDVWSVLIR